VGRILAAEIRASTAMKMSPDAQNATICAYSWKIRRCQKGNGPVWNDLRVRLLPGVLACPVNCPRRKAIFYRMMPRCGQYGPFGPIFEGFGKSFGLVYFERPGYGLLALPIALVHEGRLILPLKWFARPFEKRCAP
jgi:hypothetical protein